MCYATFLKFAMIFYLSIVRTNFALRKPLFFFKQGRSSTRSTTKKCAVQSKSLLLEQKSWENSAEHTLVIVESPTKARTIQQFLGKGYTVDFCAGHIRDLPKNPKLVPKKFKKQVVLEELRINVGDLGVDVYNNFEPIYIDMEGKKDVIDRLKNLAKSCSRILFATDEDREGEAISWHLLEALNPTVPYKRAVFHEISEAAIRQSFENPREIDMNLVQSQETRRILDRLTGFTISPLLWRYINPKLSAGRVQSCGLYLIVQRERKIRQFVPSFYFSLDALFQLENPALPSSKSQSSTIKMNLATVDGKRIATQKDFVDSTGEPVPDVLVLDKNSTENIMSWLSGLSNPAGVRFKVTDVTSRTTVKSPPQPLITSTLQQLASSHLSMSPSRAMSAAQELYENGLITYMRTDSPGLSAAAIETAKNHVLELFGKEYLNPASATMTVTSAAPLNINTEEDSEGIVADGSKKLKKKSSDKEKENGGLKVKAPMNAQEAHEAIRPVIFDGKFKTPRETSLTSNLLSLYSLIYDRTLASVMMPSQTLSTLYKVEAQSHETIDEDSLKTTKKKKSQHDEMTLTPISTLTPTTAVFKSSHSVVVFPGYTKAFGYKEIDDDEDNDDISTSDKFPKLTKGKELWLAKDILDNIASQDRRRRNKVEVLDTTATTTTVTSTNDMEEDIVHRESNNESRKSDSMDLSTSTLTDIQEQEQDQQAAGGVVGKPIVAEGLLGMHHSTRPPHRYTVAGFIKELETVGVGRPSTYASIFKILKDRNYVLAEGQTLVPTNMGMLVAGLLGTHFPDLVEPAFTAKLEESLDLIASGREDKINFLTKFYLGKDNDSGLLNRITTKLRSNEIDHRASRSLMKFGEYIIRFGSGGFFIEKDTNTLSEEKVDEGIPTTAAITSSDSSSVTPLITGSEDSGGLLVDTENGEVDHDEEEEEREEDEEKEDDEEEEGRSVRWMLPDNMQEDYRTLSESSILGVVTTSSTTQGKMMGTDPNSDLPILLRTGRYGPYVQIGYDDKKKGNKKCASVPKWVMNSNGTLEQITAFANLPVEIGTFPSLQKPVLLEMAQGRLSVAVQGYPYRVKLPDNIWIEEVTEAFALSLLDEKEVLKSQKVLGEYNETTVLLKYGRFGFYVQHGTELRSIKKLDPDTLTLEQAVELLEIPRKWKKKKPAYVTKANKALNKTKAKPKKETKTTTVDSNDNSEVVKSTAKRKAKAIVDSDSNNILSTSSSGKAAGKPKPRIKSKAKPKKISDVKSKKVPNAEQISIDPSSPVPLKKLNGYQQYVKEASKKGISISVAAADWRALSNEEKESYKTRSSSFNPSELLV